MKIATTLAALIVAGAFAATPAVAASKKKMALPMDPHKMTPEQAMEYNKRNLSLIVKGLPLILPSWSLPIYFKMNEDKDRAKPKRHRRKRH